MSSLFLYEPLLLSWLNVDEKKSKYLDTTDTSRVKPCLVVNILDIIFLSCIYSFVTSSCVVSHTCQQILKKDIECILVYHSEHTSITMGNFVFFLGIHE